tara:strand:+ start:584 stop:970 length:387 start_codon:yes stop_codon:yes gene_type:complete
MSYKYVSGDLKIATTDTLAITRTDVAHDFASGDTVTANGNRGVLQLTLSANLANSSAKSFTFSNDQITTTSGLFLSPFGATGPATGGYGVFMSIAAQGSGTASIGLLNLSGAQIDDDDIIFINYLIIE